MNSQSTTTSSSSTMSCNTMNLLARATRDRLTRVSECARVAYRECRENAECLGKARTQMSRQIQIGIEVGSGSRGDQVPRHTEPVQCRRRIALTRNTCSIGRIGINSQRFVRILVSVASPHE